MYLAVRKVAFAKVSTTVAFVLDTEVEVVSIPRSSICTLAAGLV